MSCICNSNTEILRMFQELKQDLSQVKNDCFRIRQEILGITDESHEFGLMENVTIRQVMERMAFDIETLKTRTEPTPERDSERTEEIPDIAASAVTTSDDSSLAEDRSPTPDFQNQDEYEDWLQATTFNSILETRTEDGASIRGRSISSISSSVPSEYRSLTLEIVNYNEEPLVDLQTLLYSTTTPHGTNPTTVDAKRREVFVYRGSEPSDPCIGALSFRIGSVNHRVSVYFWVYPTYTPNFGMALTAFNTTFQDLGWATGNGINYSPSEVIPKDNLPTDYVFRHHIRTNSTFSIENDPTYVRARIFVPDSRRSIWKIEVFPKPKTQELVPSRSALPASSASGQSYLWKTVLAIAESASGTRGIFVELGNGLSLPLQDAASYFSNATSELNLIPSIIASAERKIMYWTTTKGKLESIFTYRIGTSDIRLAVATSANPSSGNTFGLKFVSNCTSADSDTLNNILSSQKWERNSHKVGRADEGPIVIHMPNLRATAFMAVRPKPILNVSIEKYF